MAVPVLAVPIFYAVHNGRNCHKFATSESKEKISADWTPTFAVF